uniref:C2 domain-containing protein n=1 Tax=Chlamydomonas chlamydogama TaxID=225041 RepID=A0A7S2QT99_9CHLO|mmetsp:Transcript_135/g.242  ORF Transcript_135/g.242 Transcript_135/m.242 type:complete len:260 (+) Transcript_135:98-877(+)|eukprot:CAMPEP_0202901420 /NCGR_PEP_ID=MMETSP1392-20130828/14243_1 /ASSEMBLY_ACC=CAM_ASM_000868 /TAXON_ID=225041 /ORGANISM="Chlamydomonas chlamydogama, Strain SAG 11-48b" /LENGTH=259 /DNA_ID=CAMNT_0049587977 /DNA_START=77 /DNA_END=856 /DNA_ORIENTATION=-
MALDAGELTLTLEYGQNLKDQDWFGRQDPYCIVKCGTQTFKSRTCTDGGKNPVWNETFRFNVINENDISITCMDEDTLSRDDLIGQGTFTLAKVRERGTDRLQVPMLTKKNKQHGFISINLTYTPNTTLRPQQAYAPYVHPAYGPVSAPYGVPPPAYAPAPSAYFAPPAFAPAPSAHFAPPAPAYAPAPSAHYPSAAPAPAPAPVYYPAPPAYTPTPAYNPAPSAHYPPQQYHGATYAPPAPYYPGQLNAQYPAPVFGH